MNYENPFDDHDYDSDNSEDELENLMADWIANGNEINDDFWYYEALLRHSDEDWVDRSADGELANFLVELGYREDWWDWDVGDTP